MDKINEITLRKGKIESKIRLGKQLEIVDKVTELITLGDNKDSTRIWKAFQLGQESQKLKSVNI